MTTFDVQGPDADGIVVLTLQNDRPNVIDKEFIAGLKEALAVATHAVGKESSYHSSPGLIITGGKGGFVAGANLHEILAVETEQEVREFCKLATDVFEVIRHFNDQYPVVAAINGPCLGGGLELALWCGYRIASDEPSTSIGLPEVNLGLIPALGGASLVSQLLPFPQALDVVCSGKRYTAREAMAKGLIDRVASPDRLLEEAKKVIKTFDHSEPKRDVRRRGLDTKLGRNVISVFAKRNVRKRTNGNYPAPEKAVDVMRQGLKAEWLDQALALERDAVAELLVGENAIAKRLIRLFLDQESRKKTYPDRPDDLDPGECALPKCVGIVGAGLMGLGIAQLAAYKGFEIRIVDVNQTAVDSVPDRVKKLTTPLLKRGKISQTEFNNICARVQASTDMAIFRDCDFIIEAVVEKMDIKHKVLKQIEEKVGEELEDKRSFAFATNTSSLSVQEISEAARYPSEVIGMHFFSPVHRMPLVEIAPHPNTFPGVIEKTFRFAVALGKVPILCGDSTGFIVNRILGAYLNEAAWACIEGHSPDAIDKTMRDWGMPLGPCELMDEVGIFVSGEVAKKLEEAWPQRFDVSVLIEHMIQRNCLGKRSDKKEGFYSYKSGKKKVSKELREIAKYLKNWYSREVQPLTATRFLDVMRAQAQMLLEEGVAHSATDIDLSLILGTGYPPFQKPLIGS